LKIGIPANIGLSKSWFMIVCGRNLIFGHMSRPTGSQQPSKRRWFVTVTMAIWDMARNFCMWSNYWLSQTILKRCGQDVTPHLRHQEMLHPLHGVTVTRVRVGKMCINSIYHLYTWYTIYCALNKTWENNSSGFQLMLNQLFWTRGGGRGRGTMKSLPSMWLCKLFFLAWPLLENGEYWVGLNSQVSPSYLTMICRFLQLNTYLGTIFFSITCSSVKTSIIYIGTHPFSEWDSLKFCSQGNCQWGPWQYYRPL